eukprot:6204074-Pleurochrysis_carterae.AAC.1
MKSKSFSQDPDIVFASDAISSSTASAAEKIRTGKGQPAGTLARLLKMWERTPTSCKWAATVATGTIFPTPKIESRSCLSLTSD